MATAAFPPEPRALQKPPHPQASFQSRGDEWSVRATWEPDTSCAPATVPSMGCPWHSSPMQGCAFSRALDVSQLGTILV